MLRSVIFRKKILQTKLPRILFLENKFWEKKNKKQK